MNEQRKQDYTAGYEIGSGEGYVEGVNETLDVIGDYYEISPDLLIRVKREVHNRLLNKYEDI